MKRKPARGIPATWLLAGGISRHGSSCWCRTCTDLRNLHKEECSTCGAIHTDVDCFGKAVAS